MFGAAEVNISDWRGLLRNEIEVIVYIEREDGGRDYGTPDGDGNWIFKRYEIGDRIDDVHFLSFPRRVAEKLYFALGEYFNPRVNATTQELSATKYHLEDMRRIVFKDGE